MPVDDALLLHLHSNAIFALPAAGLAVRIATSPNAFKRVSGSVRVCRWLAGRGYPCTVPGNADPWTEAGRAVSVWRLEHMAPGPPASMAEFGKLLRDLHNQPEPPFEVRELHDPFASTATALDRATSGLDDDDRKWLTDRIRELRALWRDLQPTVPPGLIHGDAHPGNMIAPGNRQLDRGGLGSRRNRPARMGPGSTALHIPPVWHTRQRQHRPVRRRLRDRHPRLARHRRAHSDAGDHRPEPLHPLSARGRPQPGRAEVQDRDPALRRTISTLAHLQQLRTRFRTVVTS